MTREADEKRKVEDLSIINQVQNDYPENSKEAIQFAINLTRIRERDNWILILREREQAIQKTLKELKEKINKAQCPDCDKRVKNCICNYPKKYVTIERGFIDTTFKQNFGGLAE